MSQGEPKPEAWYCWKVFLPLEGDDDGQPRLLTPWGDPMEYEFPFDFLAHNETDAEELLDTYDVRSEAEESGWILVKMTIDPIRRAAKNR